MLSKCNYLEFGIAVNPLRIQYPGDNINLMECSYNITKLNLHTRRPQ